MAYSAGRDIEIGCPACGVSARLASEPLDGMLADMKLFIETHMACTFW